MKYLATLIFLLVVSETVLANTSGRSLGDIAGTLSFGAGVVTQLMWAACIVVGIVLLAAAFSQYQMHRHNPKFVPLGTPIAYLLLGLVALSIPFVDYLTGLSKGSVEDKRPASSYYYDIDK